jgi:hypothetical protein
VSRHGMVNLSRRDGGWVAPLSLPSFVRHASAMALHELTWILLAVTAALALLAWRAAPAVTVALLSGLVGAVAAYQVVAADGPEGVPAEVAWWFSVGLVAGAIYGAVATRRRGRGTWPVRGWAVAVLLLAPLACAALTFALQDACPLYVQGGICDFGGTDVLGGWIAGVVFVFAIDLLVIAMLLWLAPGPSRGGQGEGNPRLQTSTKGIALASAWTATAIAVLLVAIARPSELEAWRSAQPDAESFAPNLLAPVPAAPDGAVEGCSSFVSRDHSFDVAFDPEQVQWLEGHVPRWLPDGFGLVDYVTSEYRWDPQEGESTPTHSVAVWGDGACRRISLVLFGSARDHRRVDRLYSIVDEVGDWDVVEGRGCKASAIAAGSCLHYLARSDDERSTNGERVLGLGLQMSGIDRETGDKIALGIPV